ncbi:hypothetical protein [Halostella sp. PRR32]|uniref:hypothetical protein n=1 Tax=Halostella sp. PRR32 TaxID=3098147 RepID=UPI002B1E766D|nr:hypothetical protein [Halostella sp. PRR32]
MVTYDLSRMDVGLIAEMIAGRHGGFPEPLEETITAHATDQPENEEYSKDDIRIHSKSRSLTKETHLGVLEGVTLPEDGDWGYSQGWIPDDILVAKALTPVEGAPSPSRSREGLDPTTDLLAYYAVEVKAVSSGNRVRLTENQQEMLAIVSEEVEQVYPIIVMVDVGGLPESAEVVVDIYEESVWADGQMSKTI